MAKCPCCSAEIQTPVPYTYECPSCGKMVHSCRCCAFYSPDSHYGCKESIDEPVWDKDRYNFCDYFRLSDKAPGPKDDDRAKKSREALSKLFDF